MGYSLHGAATAGYNPSMNQLSEPAQSLFRLHVEQMGKIDVDDSNRPVYQELERAGLVIDSRPFTGNQLYRLTRAGFELKQQLNGSSPAKSAEHPRSREARSSARP